MPTYRYQALDHKGKKKKGYFDSESRARAFSRLQEQGLTPIELSRVSEETAGARARAGSWLRVSNPFGKKVKIEEAFYYLGLMLQGGDSLARSLDLLGRMGRGRTSSIWLDIRDSVESGTAFSSSLEQHPKAFPQVYVGMIQVAERAGRLGEILEKIAGYEEQRKEMQGKLVTAVTYPLVVLFIGLGAIFFLLTRVLPKIAGIFEASSQELPLSTRLLLSTGSWLEHHSLILLVVLAAVVFGCSSAYRKLPAVRHSVDARLWKLPLVRDTLLARFSGLLSFQLKAGISLVQAMRASVRGVDSAFFRERVETAADEVATGQPLDQVFARQEIFPQMYLTALGAGRKAGQLAGFMERLGRILDREVDNSLRRMVAVAEPLLILVLGIVVGFFVMAVMGPIFDLTTKI